ncbi:MAG: Hsp20/alpha crystallin family protein, partial [Luteolibacter sp.]
MNMLTKFNPFTKTEQYDLLRPLQRFDILRDMEELMRNMQRTVTGWSGQSSESMTLTDWTPSVDIGENEKEFLVKAELPEVRKEDIKVNIDDGTLSICGERKAEKEDKSTRYHRVERTYGRFERTFTLPEETDSEHITSEYKDGVLTVHLPK